MKREVLDHYESLADEFDEVSNKYCNERYRREVERYLRKEMAVLEVGCGTGLLLSKINVRKKLGCDFSKRLLAQLRERDFQLIGADAESLPFKADSFDLVYSVNLLEHVPHPDKVISEGMRVLKRGGKLVLITPNGDIGLVWEMFDRLRLKAPEGPHRFLTTGRIWRIIKSQNLRVIKIDKFVLLPSGPGFVLKFFEGVERFLPFLGFFHLVVLEKR